MDDLDARFEITRPDYLPADHWDCIAREADRLCRSLAANDGSQALGDIKCLVESIAREPLPDCADDLADWGDQDRGP